MFTLRHRRCSWATRAAVVGPLLLCGLSAGCAADRDKAFDVTTGAAANVGKVVVSGNPNSDQNSGGNISAPEAPR